MQIPPINIIDELTGVLNENKKEQIINDDLGAIAEQI